MTADTAKLAEIVASRPEAEPKAMRWLALSIVALLLLFPFYSGRVQGQITVNVIMTMIFYFGITTASDRRGHRMAALVIGIPWFILTWAELIAPDPPFWLGLTVNALILAFFTLTLSVLLSFVMRATRITADLLWGSVAIYLLLGGLWFSIYILIHRLNPGAFIHTATDLPIDPMELLYFSFVTLTTLGFGDIAPTTLVAKHFVAAEAIAGVLYLPIVISRLVGASVSSRTPTNSAGTGHPSNPE